MILIIDPEISYLDAAKAFLMGIGYDVLIAEEERELIRLCFDFRDRLDLIVFDPERLGLNDRLQEGLEYALKHAGISHIPLIEGNLDDWLSSANPRSLTETVRVNRYG